MKSLNLLPVIIAILVLSSCSKYQYVYLNGTLPKNDKKEFIDENDTCMITYSFSGLNCPITINVFNKLSTPIYVDWKKSAVIINQDKISLWDESSDSDGSSNNDHISFVPPQSSVQISPLNLMNEFVVFSPDDKVANVKVMTQNGLVNKKRHHYTMTNTPLYFRCFLTYSAKENFISETYVDHAFWISDIIPVYSELTVNQPDNFYLQKSTGFSSVASVAALAGVIYLLAIIPDDGAVE